MATCGVRDPEVRLNVLEGVGVVVVFKAEMNVQVTMSLQSEPPV